MSFYQYKLPGYKRGQRPLASSFVPPTNQPVASSSRVPASHSASSSHGAPTSHSVSTNQAIQTKQRDTVEGPPATLEEVKEHLSQLWPGEGIARTPYEPWNSDLEVNDIVWYWHIDDTWHLTLVTKIAPNSHLPEALKEKNRGHKVWFGITRGLIPSHPYDETVVFLCPHVGNAKPDNWYTRLLLYYWAEIPADKAEVEAMVRDFEEVMRPNMVVKKKPGEYTSTGPGRKTYVMKM